MTNLLKRIVNVISLKYYYNSLVLIIINVFKQYINHYD